MILIRKNFATLSSCHIDKEMPTVPPKVLKVEADEFPSDSDFTDVSNSIVSPRKKHNGVRRGGGGARDANSSFIISHERRRTTRARPLLASAYVETNLRRRK